MPDRPIVGITPDVALLDGRERAVCMLTYADAVVRAGGVPILLVPDVSTASAQLALCDALVLTGGDDPRTEGFGVPTHPKATPLAARRQTFESRIIELLAHDQRPVLGVCLGMQMMALHAGGRLDQHMPDRRPDAARHWGAEHEVVPVDQPGAPGEGRRAGAGPAPVSAAASGEFRIPSGVVHSKHRQAVEHAGTMAVLAQSDDGVIEAIADPHRPFYLGVQWHPERTADDGLGIDLFRALIRAAIKHRSIRPRDVDR